MQPLSVRHITQIESLPEVAPGSYLQARGVLASLSDDELPEVTIGRLRDAEG
jgi:hypothetical protein